MCLTFVPLDILSDCLPRLVEAALTGLLESHRYMRWITENAERYFFQHGLSVFEGRDVGYVRLFG